MRNGFDKVVEKIKTHILCRKMETEGTQMTSQYGAYAFHAGLARLPARTHKHTPTRPGTYMHAHARTHRPISNIYFFSTATMIRESDQYYVIRTLSLLLNFVLLHVITKAQANYE